MFCQVKTLCETNTQPGFLQAGRFYLLYYFLRENRRRRVGRGRRKIRFDAQPLALQIEMVFCCRIDDYENWIRANFYMSVDQLLCIKLNHINRIRIPGDSVLIRIFDLIRSDVTPLFIIGKNRSALSCPHGESHLAVFIEYIFRRIADECDIEVFLGIFLQIGDIGIDSPVFSAADPVGVFIIAAFLLGTGGEKQTNDQPSKQSDFFMSVYLLASLSYHSAVGENRTIAGLTILKIDKYCLIKFSCSLQSSPFI